MAEHSGSAVHNAHDSSVLDSVTTYIKIFSHFTARKAKKGYQYTKNAMHSMSLGKLVPGGASQFARKLNIRQLFKLKHSRELGGAAAQAETSDDETDDDDEEDEDANASVEQLYTKVDRKFFNPQFDAAKAELETLRVTYAEEPNAVEAEKRSLDELVAERQKPLNVVSHVLKKRILGNYSVFLQGVWQISAVNEDLKTTAAQSQKGRALLEQAKQRVVVGGLRITQLNRRRKNLRSVGALLQVAEAVRDRRFRFNRLLETGLFKDAIRMTQSEMLYPGEDLLRLVSSTKDEVAEWHRIVSDPQFIRGYLDKSTEECMHQKEFNVGKYLIAIEGYCCLNEESKSASNIITLGLWELADQLLVRTVSELSVAPGETEMKVLARGILPENIIPCMCRIGAKAVDFLAHYRGIMSLHEHVSADPNTAPQLSAFHRKIKKAVSSFGARIAVSWYNDLSLVLQGLPIHALDLEKVLHVFDIAMLCTEALALFGTTSETTAGARAAVKLSLTNYISKFHQQSSRGSIHLLNRMQEDTWRIEPNGVVPSMFKVLAPLSPQPYKQKVKWVKKFIVDRADQLPVENPFLSEEMMLPQDPSRDVHVKPFKASEARTVVTSTSVVVANFLFEFLVRVAVRFPPIANEVIIWCEELVALYFIVVASNFMPSSEDVTLEERPEFTETTKKMMLNLREMALTCAPHLRGRNSEGPMFPPIFHGAIGAVLGSPDHSFGLVERITAVESVFPLLGLLREALTSVEPLLSETVFKEQIVFLNYFENCAEEVQQVIIYHVCEDVFDVKTLTDEAAKAKYEGRAEMYPNSYALHLANTIRQYIDSFRGAFPSEFTEVLFWKLFLLAIERALLRGYSKAAGPFSWQKLSDVAVSQMRVDVQAVGQTVKQELSGHRIPWGDYVDGFLRAFFLVTFDEQLRWVKANHKRLMKADIIGWFSASDRDKRQALEAVLREVEHEDCMRWF